MSINIRAAYERKSVAVKALCEEYAERALQLARDVQPMGTAGTSGIWDNQTGQAIARLFAEAYETDSTCGFFIAHEVDYGIYLELANNRQREILRPIIEELAPKFLEDVKVIYGA